MGISDAIFIDFIKALDCLEWTLVIEELKIFFSSL